MSNAKIYPGVSLWFQNRSKPNDSHSWLVNNARPAFGMTHTRFDGSKFHADLFISKDNAVQIKAPMTKASTVKVPANHVVIVFPADLSVPLAKINFGLKP